MAGIRKLRRSVLRSQVASQAVWRLLRGPERNTRGQVKGPAKTPSLAQLRARAKATPRPEGTPSIFDRVRNAFGRGR